MVYGVAAPDSAGAAVKKEMLVKPCEAYTPAYGTAHKCHTLQVGCSLDPSRHHLQR
jgi:hypothetical protein